MVAVIEGELCGGAREEVGDFEEEVTFQHSLSTCSAIVLQV